jgi:hypothetical protein
MIGAKYTSEADTRTAIARDVDNPRGDLSCSAGMLTRPLKGTKTF